MYTETRTPIAACMTLARERGTEIGTPLATEAMPLGPVREDACEIMAWLDSFEVVGPWIVASRVPGAPPRTAMPPTVPAGAGSRCIRCGAVLGIGPHPDPHEFDPKRYRYPVSGNGNTASSSMRV